MNRNGQTYTQILNVESKLSIQNTGMTGQVSKKTDHFTKSEVLCLTNNGKIRIPRTQRRHLDIPFPYFVLQTYIPSSKLFNLEIGIEDTSLIKRRLIFTHCREVMRHPIHSRVPLSSITKDCWNNICIDLRAYVLHCWGTHFDTLKSISISGNCRVRRIFSIKFPLQNSTLPIKQQIRHQILPSNYELPWKVNPISQILSPKQDFPTSVFIEEKTMLKQTRRILPKLQNRSLAPSIFRPNYYQHSFNSMVNLEASTPPLVNTTQGVVYDPLTRNYLEIKPK